MNLFLFRLEEKKPAALPYKLTGREAATVDKKVFSEHIQPCSIRFWPKLNHQSLCYFLQGSFTSINSLSDSLHAFLDVFKPSSRNLLSSWALSLHSPPPQIIDILCLFLFSTSEGVFKGSCVYSDLFTLSIILQCNCGPPKMLEIILNIKAIVSCSGKKALLIHESDVIFPIRIQTFSTKFL